jgi:hypothetical protein
LNPLAEALRGLSPRSCALDRDAILFRAGQTAAPHRSGWLWPCATAVSMTVAFLGVLLAWSRPQPVVVVVERVVPPPAPAPTPPVRQAAAPDSAPDSPLQENLDFVYQSPQRRLQEHLLRWGLDGLGAPVPDPEPPPQRPGDTLFHPLSSSGELVP